MSAEIIQMSACIGVVAVAIRRIFAVPSIVYFIALFRKAGVRKAGVGWNELPIGIAVAAPGDLTLDVEIVRVHLIARKIAVAPCRVSRAVIAAFKHSCIAGNESSVEVAIATCRESAASRPFFALIVAIATLGVIDRFGRICRVWF